MDYQNGPNGAAGPERTLGSMHPDDRLLVATIFKPADWVGFNKACSDWLKTNL
jgi:hypothetical protein